MNAAQTRASRPPPREAQPALAEQLSQAVERVVCTSARWLRTSMTRAFSSIIVSVA